MAFRTGTLFASILLVLGGLRAQTVISGTSHATVPSTPSATKSLNAKAQVSGRDAGPVTPLGSVVTASAAQSFALNGNLAYTCDNNEISVIDVSNPASPHIVGTATNTIIQNSGDIHCDIQRNTLVIFSDQTTNQGSVNSPGFVAFSLTNPTQPSPLASTPLNRRFFDKPLYLGNYAFVPTNAITFFGPTWDSQYGDLLSVDLTNFTANPLPFTTLEQQVVGVYGGPTSVFGITQASGNLALLGGSTSTGPSNNGQGRLQTVDLSSPTAVQIVGQVLIPLTKQFAAPLVQGTIAVGIGNTGGYIGATNQNPESQGNIVVATFDVSDPRQPTILSVNQTTYKPGVGGGSSPIGNNLFAFAGVFDSGGNNVLLTVDVTNPLNPVLGSIPIPTPFTSMQAAGTTLYATLGTSGFATYSIPGISNTGLSVCPVSVDMVLMIDRGANIPSQAFQSAEAALQSFVGTLHLPSDQVAVGSFTTSGTINQTLTTSASQADAAIAAIIPGGTSYIGAGILAAQNELTGPRHNPSATPTLLILSDGGDAGAPTPAATVAAANAAKAAGIQIITLQYGTGPTTLMQSLASSTGAFYQVPQ